MANTEPLLQSMACMNTATEHEYARTEHAVMYVQSEVADFGIKTVSEQMRGEIHLLGAYHSGKARSSCFPPGDGSGNHANGW